MNPVPRTAARSEINVTPLIDIVLVLLIVFIVMVPGLMKASSVVVPRTKEVGEKEGRKPLQDCIVVTLEADGRVLLQQEEVGLGQLKEKLLPAVRFQPMDNRKVVLKVDGDLPHQRAVDALDQIRLVSDQVKRESAADPLRANRSGSDVKVVIAVKKA